MAGRSRKEVQKSIINVSYSPMDVDGKLMFKCTNSDWGTIAFQIDRGALEDKQCHFGDKELYFNGIYFLIGNVDGIEKIYVGQAKKRNSGDSIIARLREHADPKIGGKEKYFEIWSRTIAITGIYDDWGPTELNMIESIMESEIPEEHNLNGNHPNAGSSDNEKYADKIKQIELYLASFQVKTFLGTDEAEQIQTTYIPNEHSKVEDLQNGMARIPEIVTPSKVVKQMVDMLPADVWNDKTVFLDPACKGGEYLREIYDRLMENEFMKAKYPNLIKRSNHILSEQIYGIALSEVSKSRTTELLDGFGINIKVIPNYLYILKGKNLENESARAILNKEFNRDMNIDVIIGNPPYQDSNGSGNGGGGTAVYDKFVLMAFELSKKYISFITPARWYTDENKVVALKNKLLECNNIVELHDYPNAEEVFGGVYIMGGVCYYLINKDYDGACRVIEHRDAKVIESIRPIKESFSDIFIRNKDAVSILKKVIERPDFSSFCNNIYDYNIFKLRSYERGSVIKDDYNCIKLYYTGNDSKGGGIGYISRDEVFDNDNIISKHKVFINSVSDNMLAFPYKTLYKGFYGEPGSVCTESYLTIGNIENEDTANNVIKYLQTRFVRILVQQRKTSQLAYKKIYRFVPNQNFSKSSDIDWSKSISEIDSQLYKKYGISKDEIAYIEKTIKPMDDAPIKPKVKLTTEDIQANYINKMINNQ